jgi:cytochrome c553
MGKQEKKTPASKLRKWHKFFGLSFLLLMLLNAVLGIHYWAQAGDALSTRAVLHAVLALSLAVTLLLKLSIVKLYMNFLRFAPGLGMLVFCLGFVVFAVSGGFYSVRSLVGAPVVDTAAVPLQGDSQAGALLFETRCSSCHHSDKEEALFGPGLAGLLKKETLPSSGRAATLDNVKTQLLQPYRSMPAFDMLTASEMADLLAYMEIL